MISEPSVVIRLDSDTLVFRPGEVLAGQYWTKSLEVRDVKAIEVSVLWHTEGKGDDDMAVHEFWRRDADDMHPIDPGQPTHFSTTLPNSPLSYEGQIVKLRWFVRVRVFLYRGKEVVGEKLLQLGDVVPSKVKSS